MVWPILTIIAGFVLALMTWWLNSRILPRTEAIQSIKKIQKILSKHEFLQVYETDELGEQLRSRRNA